jgi:glycosyltransferase involved in cell wall biosynthesis
VWRRGGGLFANVQAVRQLRALYRSLGTVVVHHVAMKSIVFGGFAALGLRHVTVVNAVTGLGFAFTSSSAKAAIVRPLLRAVLRWLLGRPSSLTIVQNAADAAEIRTLLGGPNDTVRMVPGVGVDLRRFRPVPEPDGQPLVVLPARLLRDKGVVEFVEAARLLRTRGVRCRMALVGGTDANLAAIPESQATAWVAAKDVEWWGRRADMPAVFAEAAVVCLPSYREGISKALLEAAAAGRPIVTCDVPGCRDVVTDDIEGLLVPPRDAVALANALERLLCDPSLRGRYGAAARARAEREFDETQAAELIVAVLDEARRGASAP